MNALFIGRFQPFHNGHAELTRLISKEYPEFILGIGSAQSSYVIFKSEIGDSDILVKIDYDFHRYNTIENPFTARERILMIKDFLKSEDIRNYKIYEIPDLNVYSADGKKRSVLPLYVKNNYTDETNKLSIKILSSSDVMLPKSYEFPSYISIEKASNWVNQGISKEGWKLSVNAISSLISSVDTSTVVSSIPRDMLLEWVDHVISKVPKFDIILSNNYLTKELFQKKGYLVKETPLFSRDEYSGTEIRRRMLKDEPWEYLVPESVAKVIKNINGVKRLKDLSH